MCVETPLKNGKLPGLGNGRRGPERFKNPKQYMGKEFAGSAQGESPGPAVYMPSVGHTGSQGLGDAPKYTFHGSKTTMLQDIQAHDKSAGPIYTPQQQNSAGGLAYDGPKYSFGSRTALSKKFEAPGPGTYSQDKKGCFGIQDTSRGRGGKAVGMSQPRFSFGGAERETVDVPNRNFPPPGAYDPKQLSSNGGGQLGDCTAFSFGHDQRMKDRSNSTGPDPTTYTLPSSMGRQPTANNESLPSYSLGASRTAVKYGDVHKPGPGSYQLSSTLKSHGVGFGKAARFDADNNLSPLRKHAPFEVPGPGHYPVDNLGRSIGPQATSPSAPSFSLGGRDNPNRGALSQSPGCESPGPVYSAKVLSNGQAILGDGAKYSFGSRTALSKKFEAPGPGTYDMQSIVGGKQPSKSRSPSFGFSSKANTATGNKDRGIENTHSGSGLGPGQYTIPNGMDNAKGCSFLGAKDISRDQHVPGPGTYEPSSHVGKHQPQSINESPSSFSFGLSKSDGFKEKQVRYMAKDLQPAGGSSTPGPGNYHAHTTSFGKQVLGSRPNAPGVVF